MAVKFSSLRFYLLSALLTALAALWLTPAHAAAQMPAAAEAGGLWAGFTHALQTAQKNFDTEITALMSNFRHDSKAGWWLIGISFLYGVLHAAGPGHGKAVISSYLVANNETLKRGIVLAFLSSLLQAATAIILVGLVFLIFTGKEAQQAATRDLEIIGSALIMLLGLRLLLRKSAALRKGKTAAPAKAAAQQHRHHAHGHQHTEKDCGCGHSHIAAPKALQSMDWKQALPLIISVGIRPCTGALVVMSFALMSGLFALGASAVLAMSFGTFLVVCALAAIAVNAKNLALKLSKRQTSRLRLQSGLEWAAALFIFFSGGLLLIASLY